MNEQEIINKLKEEVKKNQVANDLFHVFASRRRARQTIYTTSLYHKMVAEGFNHSKEDYLPVLKLMASLGIGQLDISPTGKIKGLKGIKIKLQSLGHAVVENGRVEGFTPRAKYHIIHRSPVMKPEMAEMTLIINIHNKPVKIEIPKGLTPEEIAGLIAGIQFKEVS